MDGSQVTQPSRDRRWDLEPQDAADLPVDPDLPQAPVRTDPFRVARRTRWPRIHGPSVAAVGAGGFLGGLARYGIGLAWPSPGGSIPWATVGVNTGGAFLLALLLVLISDVLPPTRFARPALATGLCGAFTTFSSVVVDADRLVGHDHVGRALAFLGVSLVAGLAAVALGLVLGRSVAAARDRRRRR